MSEPGSNTSANRMRHFQVTDEEVSMDERHVSPIAIFDAAGDPISFGGGGGVTPIAIFRVNSSTSPGRLEVSPPSVSSGQAVWLPDYTESEWDNDTYARTKYINPSYTVELEASGSTLGQSADGRIAAALPSGHIFMANVNAHTMSLLSGAGGTVLDAATSLRVGVELDVEPDWNEWNGDAAGSYYRGGYDGGELNGWVLDPSTTYSGKLTANEIEQLVGSGAEPGLIRSEQSIMPSAVSFNKVFTTPVDETDTWIARLSFIVMLNWATGVVTDFYTPGSYPLLQVRSLEISLLDLGAYV